MNRRIGQIALVVCDQGHSTDFYSRVFGLDHIFGTTAFRGETADRIQGMENVASSTRWLVDDRELFQLEIFQFEHPRSRPLPTDHSIRDVGYNRVIIAVKSLHETNEKAVANGGTVTALLFEDRPDSTNHAVLKDPDGIMLELIEAPELVPGERPARLIGLGITTEDLTTTVEDMCAGFGFAPCEDQFQHRTFWQEDGLLEREQTLQLGDMYLVISQYRDARPRPSHYRLSDLGIMNFAICFSSQADFDSCYRVTQQMGMQSNSEPLVSGHDASVTYNNDRQGFSVEMIYMARKLRGLYGFEPPRFRDRILACFMEWKVRRDYRRHLARGKA